MNISLPTERPFILEGEKPSSKNQLDSNILRSEWNAELEQSLNANSIVYSEDVSSDQPNVDCKVQDLNTESVLSAEEKGLKENISSALNKKVVKNEDFFKKQSSHPELLLSNNKDRLLDRKVKVNSSLSTEKDLLVLTSQSEKLSKVSLKNENLLDLDIDKKILIEEVVCSKSTPFLKGKILNELPVLLKDKISSEEKTNLDESLILENRPGLIKNLSLENSVLSKTKVVLKNIHQLEITDPLKDQVVSSQKEISKNKIFLNKKFTSQTEIALTQEEPHSKETETLKSGYLLKEQSVLKNEENPNKKDDLLKIHAVVDEFLTEENLLPEPKPFSENKTSSNKKWNGNTSKLLRNDILISDETISKESNFSDTLAPVNDNERSEKKISTVVTDQFNEEVSDPKILPSKMVRSENKGFQIKKNQHVEPLENFTIILNSDLGGKKEVTQNIEIETFINPLEIKDKITIDLSDEEKIDSSSKEKRTNLTHIKNLQHYFDLGLIYPLPKIIEPSEFNTVYYSQEIGNINSSNVAIDVSLTSEERELQKLSKENSLFNLENSSEVLHSFNKKVNPQVNKSKVPLLSELEKSPLQIELFHFTKGDKTLTGLTEKESLSLIQHPLILDKVLNEVGEKKDLKEEITLIEVPQYIEMAPDFKIVPEPTKLNEETEFFSTKENLRQQISEHLDSIILKGKNSEITLTMEPPELGKVTIKLHFQDDKVQAEVLSSHPEFLKDIELSKMDLVHHLQEKEIILDKFEVRLTGSQTSFNDQRGSSNQDNTRSQKEDFERMVRMNTLHNKEEIKPVYRKQAYNISNKKVDKVF